MAFVNSERQRMALEEASLRRASKLLAEDCAAIAKEILEAEEKATKNPSPRSLNDSGDEGSDEGRNPPARERESWATPTDFSVDTRVRRVTRSGHHIVDEWGLEAMQVQRAKELSRQEAKDHALKVARENDDLQRALRLSEREAQTQQWWRAFGAYEEEVDTSNSDSYSAVPAPQQEIAHETAREEEELRRTLRLSAAEARARSWARPQGVQGDEAEASDSDSHSDG